ncbi:uncharacterized protein F5147DRAFT_760907 [Suillus discolor]|uniref:Uncharacterized protein n=1 Tax=Suillus discolor TaxID=1912936 RepID=A0A9P7F880_9AGAM|nr:uncharacterized protein F5147DRAFT_760907 [Suillus discolor]KAG2108685.1 hypothetical protein F5147DRAFT_760907 [Suillus discolor]
MSFVPATTVRLDTIIPSHFKLLLSQAARNYISRRLQHDNHEPTVYLFMHAIHYRADQGSRKSRQVPVGPFVAIGRDCSAGASFTLDVVEPELELYTRNTNERPQRSTPIQKKISAPPSNTSTSKINSDITEVLSEGYCANLCALDWQSNGHQKEPASVFAFYWNGLSKADKEVYKCKAAAQLKSAASGVSTTGNDVDEE